MSKKHFSLLFFPFIALIVGNGCTFTTTTRIHVILSENVDSVSASILNLINCEHVNINGKETKTNGKPSISELTVEIINPKDLPTDQTSQKILAYKIVCKVEPAVANKDHFNIFTTLFVFQEIHGSVTTTKTVSYSWPTNYI